MRVSTVLRALNESSKHTKSQWMPFDFYPLPVVRDKRNLEISTRASLENATEESSPQLKQVLSLSPRPFKIRDFLWALNTRVFLLSTSTTTGKKHLTENWSRDWFHLLCKQSCTRSAAAAWLFENLRIEKTFEIFSVASAEKPSQSPLWF